MYYLKTCKQRVGTFLKWAGRIFRNVFFFGKAFHVLIKFWTSFWFGSLFGPLFGSKARWQSREARYKGGLSLETVTYPLLRMIDSESIAYGAMNDPDGRG